MTIHSKVAASVPQPASFSITILGSGTGVPRKHRRAPGLIVQAGSTPLLFDSGSGAAYQLPHAGVNYSDLDHLFYTHFAHPDHINDLAELIFANKYFDPRRTRELHIYGPKGIRDFMARLIKLFPIFSDLDFPLIVDELDESTIALEHVAIVSKPMNHQNNACAGYRITYAGKSITYSGDTDYCDNLIELASGSDLLVAECSFPNEQKTQGHLIPAEIAKIAARASVKEVILTHLYPPSDAADVVAQVQEGFTGEVTKAEDLMIRELF